MRIYRNPYREEEVGPKRRVLGDSGSITTSSMYGSWWNSRPVPFTTKEFWKWWGSFVDFF
jgi:hypothetical protein